MEFSFLVSSKLDDLTLYYKFFTIISRKGLNDSANLESFNYSNDFIFACKSSI